MTRAKLGRMAFIIGVAVSLNIGFMLTGYLIAGVPGQVAGMFLSWPLCAVWGVFAGMKL